jgi:hypothetical protein
MLLLNNLNEAGFQKLKEDREVLLNEIKHLQSILTQFDLAYPFLSSIFEPEVKIKYDKSKDRYSGYFKIEHPNLETRKFNSFFLGDSKRYKGIEDPQLIIDGKMRARKKIQKLFPEMFEDANR